MDKLCTQSLTITRNFTAMKEEIRPLPLSWINTTIIEHFEAIALKFPQKVALNDGENILTYKEVLSLTYNIAKKIEVLEGNNNPVIILLENNAFFICTMLACLAKGRGYIPLDAGYSRQRNQQIISHCQAKTIISQSWLTKDYSLNTTLQFIEFNPDFIEGSNKSYNNNPESLAYIIYTSGSTGQPKGVFQNQRNLLYDVMQYINVAEITVEDKLSLLYSPSVNGSIRDIYGALLTGATLFINNLQKHGVTSIPNFISHNELTIYHSIPSIFRTGVTYKSNQSFNTVRLIYLAGDKIFKQDIDIYKQTFSDVCKVYIGIGSTENATIYRQWFIDKKTQINSGVVPVGYEVEDRFMTLVDTKGEEVEKGFLGEIYVRSRYCALGYWMDDELTQKHFILHEDGSRTVKTGDWGLINADGLLAFKGRRDGQIKINGFRVEIGEIESYIRTVEGVDDAAILVRNQYESNKIVAYILLHDYTSLEYIKTKLESILAAHMFPSFFYAVEKIPYLNNFKIDYQALQILDKQNLERENSVNFQDNLPIKKNHLYIKERLLTLWCKYASYESFKNDLTWKMGGGSSLEAVNFIVSLEQEFRVEFPNEWIHEAIKPSIIETQIKQLLNLETPPLKTSENELIHIYVFPPLRGITPQNRAFLRELGKYVPLTLIDYPLIEEWKEEDVSIEKIGQTIEKRIFEKGVHKVFLGHCSGDRIAFYILNQLEEKYPNSLHFFIIDTWSSISFTFIRRIERFGKRVKLLRFVGVTKRYLQYRIGEIVRNKKLQKTPQLKITTEQYPFKPMSIKSHLMISAENDFSEDMMGWKYFLPKLTSELCTFKHSEIYTEEKNQQVVLASILRFIEEIKQS